jgi:hypothetical protein
LPQSNVGVSCRIQPQRTSTNSRIVDTRRRSTRSQIANRHVVHVGVADRVLVAECVVADGYGLVAFDVFTEGIFPEGNVKGARGVTKKRAGAICYIGSPCCIVEQGVSARSRIALSRGVQPQRTSPNSSVAHPRRRTQLQPDGQRPRCSCRRCRRGFGFSGLLGLQQWSCRLRRWKEERCCLERC